MPALDFIPPAPECERDRLPNGMIWRRPERTGAPGRMTGTSPDGSQRGHDSTAARADAGWKAGLARGKITPPPLVVLLVFGDHTVPFDSVVADIHTKTLALEDSHGHRLVI